MKTILDTLKRKWSEYLLELIVIILGILGAFSLSNWNESRKNSNIETQFLVSFRKDLLANKLELERVIRRSGRTHEKADSILMAQSGKIEGITPSELQVWIMSINGFTVYSSREGTIQDILGSGSLGVIKNDSIRLAIVSWQSNLSRIREWEKLNKKSAADYSDYRNMVLDTYKGRGNFTLTKNDISKLFHDRLFLNLVNDRKGRPRTLNMLYKRELPKLDALLKLIDKSL